MPELSIRTQDGTLLAHELMAAEGRYVYYELWGRGDFLVREGLRYTLHRITVSKPSGDCELVVSFHSYVPTETMFEEC